ncbi:hypothetical protein SBA3_1550017 [Candidatus Sulfopaludibacter sp. SbA3]|nr:hypothetical protein SBA3_1550017 [Candidatus Sulfopaludibacter sp. SbA3]
MDSQLPPEAVLAAGVMDSQLPPEAVLAVVVKAPETPVPARATSIP